MSLDLSDYIMLADILRSFAFSNFGVILFLLFKMRSTRIAVSKVLEIPKWPAHGTIMICAYMVSFFYMAINAAIRWNQPPTWRLPVVLLSVFLFELSLYKYISFLKYGIERHE